MPVYMKQFSNWKTTQKSRSTYWNSCDLILFFDIFINLKYFFNKTSPPQSILDDHHDGDYYDDYDNAKDLSAISVTVIWPTIWFLSPPSPHSCDAPRLKLSMQCIQATIHCIGYSALCIALQTAVLHCNAMNCSVDALYWTALYCLIASHTTVCTV